MVKEIPLTQGKVALVDDKDYPLVNQYKWCVTRSSKRSRIWYAYHPKSIPLKSTLIHRLILGLKDGEFCDHINGNGLDNRRCNLRIATNQQNMMNQRKQSGRSSKYKGVCWDKQTNKWIVHIRFNRTMIHLGRFSDEVDAARVYDKAAKRYFGEYAKLNFNEPSPPISGEIQ